MNDHDKVKRVLTMVDDLITYYQSQRQMFITSDQPHKIELMQETLDDLQEIKEFLES